MDIALLVASSLFALRESTVVSYLPTGCARRNTCQSITVGA
ncbi:hypothetical protein BCF44_117114 [Kutzneria buriramensis]|uniref:Uncharacterized protein n=1 Tax=Kutzneria buriramensis TaxID=1045776 RepID=A0A3E0H1M0_9PSEU|nr:hypothetical protein BCF44_117114 [Kutzneria buriramensis]